MRVRVQHRETHSRVYIGSSFVRQFANSDRSWFDNQEWTSLKAWLEAFEVSPRFQSVMPKWNRWQPGDTPVVFP